MKLKSCRKHIKTEWETSLLEQQPLEICCSSCRILRYMSSKSQLGFTNQNRYLCQYLVSVDIPQMVINRRILCGTETYCSRGPPFSKCWSDSNHRSHDSNYDWRRTKQSWLTIEHQFESPQRISNKSWFKLRSDRLIPIRCWTRWTESDP